MTTDNTAPNARKREFRCQTWPIDNVRLANRSVRRHKPRQIAMLKASLEHFDQLPILVSAKGEIIDGHAVVVAARELGWSSIRVIVVDGYTADEITALRIALNKQAEAGEWDYEVLAEDLADLIDLDFDVEALGFEIAEVDKIFDVASVVAEGEPDDEAVPSTSLIRVGDCFQIGPHRLLCGDSTKAKHVARLMGSDVAKAALTDPPFNVTINGHVSGLGAASHEEFVMGSGEMSDDEFGQFLHCSIIAMLSGIEKGGLLFIAMDWRSIELLLRVGRELKLELINVCVWVKNNAGMGSFYRSQHELFAVFRKPGASHRNNIQLGRFGRHRSNVWHYDGANSFGRTRDEDLAMHPTVKPTPLIEDIIKDCTKTGEIILDPFGGSGTALIAAQKTKRVARVMELDPRYVETALRRYQKKYREAPIHVETGRTLDELIAQRLEEPDAPPHPCEEGGCSMTNGSPRNRTRNRSKRTDYEIGYGKPPTDSRFKPGQSGNPRGRPRKKTEEVTLADILEEKQTITDRRGRTRRVCTRELIYLKLVQMAVAGDKKAIQMVWSNANADGPEGEQVVMDYLAALSNDYLDGLVDEAVEQVREGRLELGSEEGSDDE